MEGSISGELYSEILKNSSTGLDSRPAGSALCETSVVSEVDEGDLWYDDEASNDCAPERSGKTSDLDREWLRRRNQLHNIGYRDGLMAGKEASAQEGFNIGFKESVLVGRNFGFVRGVTSALACLPNGTREKLAETEEKRMRFKRLHESVGSLSTSDALKLFHDGLTDKLAKSRIAETNYHREDMDGQILDANHLEAYYEELKSLILESPAIKLHPGIE